VIVMLSWSGSVMAQSAQPSSPSEGWLLEVTPYLWGSGLDGELGVRDRTADVEASFSNILSHLHFAAMGLADARHGRILAITDVVYTDLRGHHATPGPLFASVNPQQKLFILTPEAGYRLLETDATSLDVVGGVRVWHASSELQFQPGVLSGIDLQDSQSWVDGIGGLRARQTLGRHWWVSAYGDFGAGGSSRTYQLIGNVGVAIRHRYALLLGYRYLSVDYSERVMLDTAMKGPLLGLTVKF